MMVATLPADAREPADRLAALCRTHFGAAFSGLHLCGSAASGVLQPQSDLDFLVIVDGRPATAVLTALVGDLLALSGPYPRRPDGPRCLEVLVLDAAELAGPAPPQRAELLYGEWLREGFSAAPEPAPFVDPVVTLLLAQARDEALPIVGGPLAERLAPVSPAAIGNAMQSSLPALLADLHGDERNVLLTLARMWRTAVTGDFVAKDAAANWAAPQLPAAVAETLSLAAQDYRGEVSVDWQTRGEAVDRAAATLEHRVLAALDTEPAG